MNHKQANAAYNEECEGGFRHRSPLLRPPPTPLLALYLLPSPPHLSTISGARGSKFRTTSPWQLRTCPDVSLGRAPLAPMPLPATLGIGGEEGGVEHDIFAFDHLSSMSRGVSVLKMTTSLQKKGL